jgi:thiamine-phosphate pyrophosphorylase
LILHLVTDRRRLSGATADLARARQCLLLQAQHAVDARIDVLQIREPDLEASELARLVTGMVAMARGSRSCIVVNDRLDVALACGAGGVHLRANSMPPLAARSIAPRGFLIGRSVHTLEEAAAVASDVDYLIAGTVWPSESKPGGTAGPPLLGLSGLATIAAAVSVPVLAIGGVTLDRIPGVAACGAAGVAAIGLFIASQSDEDGSGCRALALDGTVEAARAWFDSSRAAS